MSLVLEKTVAPKIAARDGVIDCDMHPALRSPDVLKPYLSRQWWDYWQTYGLRGRHGFVRGTPYPKIAPSASRRDAWPETGGGPGSDLKLMQTQHLDHHNIQFGMLVPLSPSGGDQNSELSRALCSAINDWQIDAWTSRERRLKASLTISYEDGLASRDEIHRRAANRDFAQVLMLSRTSEPWGKRRYWPIYEAACAHNLPIAIHVFGYSGSPMTNSGWPSYYLEEGAAHPSACQASIASMIFEGVFEHFPDLRILIIEAGFGWLPPTAWRLDKIWKRLRSEVPHVKRPPSEYIRKHFWLTTQPIEEAPRPADVVATMAEIGFDRLLFASDYPHWDFDDPKFGLPPALNAEQRAQLRYLNAQAFYGI